MIAKPVKLYSDNIIPDNKTTLEKIFTINYTFNKMKDVKPGMKGNFKVNAVAMSAESARSESRRFSFIQTHFNYDCLENGTAEIQFHLLPQTHFTLKTHQILYSGTSNLIGEEKLLMKSSKNCMKCPEKDASKRNICMTLILSHI